MSNTHYWENLALIVVLVLESKSSLIVQSYCVLGLEGLSRDPRFDQNTLWDSGNVNGLQDLTATRVAGFPKHWLWEGDWESRYSEWRWQTFGTRDSRQKGARMWNRGTGFPTLCVLFISLCVLDTLSCTVRYCSELYCTDSFCIAFDCTEQYLLYYIALFCIVFYCIAFYFIELHWIVVDKILKSHSLQRDYSLEFPLVFLRLIHRIVPVFKTSLELSN